MSNMSSSTAYYVGFSALATYFLYFVISRKFSKDKAPPAEKKYVGTVKQLNFHPMKSARSFNVNEVKIQSSGFQIGMLGDRGMAVITPRGHAITGMRDPTMTVIGTRVQDDKVYFTAPGLEELTIDLKQVEKEGKRGEAKFMGTSAEVYDCGQEAADWISDHLDKAGHRIGYCGVNLRKRTIKESSARIAKVMHMEYSKEYMDRIPHAEMNMANSSPVSVITEASFNDVNERLPRPIDLARLRTNIVVGGLDDPYAEDNWEDIYIGDNVHIRFARSCARCSIVDTDPDTGIKERGPTAPINNMREWRTLYKSEKAEYVFLCIVCMVIKTGTIKVGDPVYATKAPPREIPHKPIEDDQ